MSTNASAISYIQPPIRIYFYYRLTLGIVLYIMFISQFADNVLGKDDPRTFTLATLSYILFCILSFFLFTASDLQSYPERLSVMLGIDLIAISLVIHSSGGLDSGLGYLLLVSVATASIFMKPQFALAFAAITSFFAFGEALVHDAEKNETTRQLFSAGVLGIFIFITSGTFIYLTNRIKVSSEAALQQKLYAEQLQNLAQHIVKRMRTGIVVVNNEMKIELVNESALQLIGLDTEEEYFGERLGKISNLQNFLEKTDRSINSPQIHEIQAGQQVRIGIRTLDQDESQRIILFLEDYRSIVQQAQQLKLASLGRLTASIAHEIRNPLGSISHAAQLLSESTDLNDGDRRFIQIILQNSVRVNQIVENTSVLSRRKEPAAEPLNLAKWLPTFIDEFSLGKDAKISTHFNTDEVIAKIDPSNLRQILTNLMDNALRYSKQATGDATATVKAGFIENVDMAYLEVIDDGEGIPESKRDSVFEPFYTTDKQGSGLGLYISKELCEINQATLTYKINRDGKSCFRISFPHFRRTI